MAAQQSHQPSFDYAKLEDLLKAAQGDDIYDQAVNAPFSFKVATNLLFLGIILLVVIDDKRQGLIAKAISKTDFASDIDNMAALPIDAVFIPLNDQQNLLVKAIKSGKPQPTSDWSYLLHPVMTPEQARFTQASGGIAFTAVHPVTVRGTQGVLIYSFFRRDSTESAAQDEFTAKYSALVSKLAQ